MIAASVRTIDRQLLMLNGYLALVSTLLTSSSVKAFLAYQRNRGSQ